MSGRGCPNRARSQFGTPRRYLGFRRSLLASASGNRRRRDESSRNVCPIEDDRIRCSRYSPPEYSPAWDGTRIVPCRYEGGSERSHCGRPRKPARLRSGWQERRGRRGTAKRRSLQIEPGPGVHSRVGWPAREKYSAGRQSLSSAGPLSGSDQNWTRKPNRKYLWSSTRPNGLVAVICINPFRFFTDPSGFN